MAKMILRVSFERSAIESGATMVATIRYMSTTGGALEVMAESAGFEIHMLPQMLPAAPAPRDHTIALRIVRTTSTHRYCRLAFRHGSSYPSMIEVKRGPAGDGGVDVATGEEE